jgi:hypothetical protein
MCLKLILIENFSVLIFNTYICQVKIKKNEIYYVQYVSNDVENSAEDVYCIILNV